MAISAAPAILPKVRFSPGRSAAFEKVMSAIGRTQQGITDSTRQVNVLVDEVRASSNEQARGVKQISAALVQMQQVTQQTAASAQESAAAGEEISSQTRAMKATVTRLASLL